jgi:selenocysteine lyase/cysteine desulfurase
VPYIEIDMHPQNPLEKLDAVFFSPHKFLGGPGSSGVLIFDSKMYQNKIPDNPGGGTVNWTNPWGNFSFMSDIEVREDGGTPGFLQAIKGVLAVRLKEDMTEEKMMKREKELIKIAFIELEKIPNLHLLDGTNKKRLGIFSFYVKNIHYNLIIKLLNDRFGIQSRGGCSCAGTYGHYLLHVSPRKSKYITDKIDHGDLSEKPGWVRISLHPTMTYDELRHIIGAIKEIIRNASRWEKDYTYSSVTNEFIHIKSTNNEKNLIKKWFRL